MRLAYRSAATLLVGAGLSWGCAGDAPPEAEAEAAPAPEATTAVATLINPNLASADEIASATGLAAAAAQAVVASRPFLTADALHGALSAAVGDEAAVAAYSALWVPINLNDVSREEILRIPGVGERMAHEFEEYRPYEDMDQFRREIGKYVDSDEVERLASYVYVPIDLNTASEEAILAIPGVDNRMAHEFEEYRPYEDMDQFRREIGKYVDENEVARLERYVTLR